MSIICSSVNIDCVYAVPAIVRPGQTIASTAFTQSPGGKGANVAVAISRANGNASFAANLGEDGAYLLSLLRQNGVDTQNCNILQTPTGRAIIQVAQDGENSIILFPGANHQSLPIPHFSFVHSVFLQNEILFSSTLAILNAAKSHNLTTFYNPSPLPSPSQLAELPWHNVDWLIVNQGEASALEAALECSDLFASPKLENCNIVVTLGARGAMCRLAGSSQVHQVDSPPLKGQVVDTTGAGDCFAGYMTALVTQTDHHNLTDKIQDILRVANAAAGLCVQKHGAWDSFPKLYHVQELLGDEWPSSLV